MRKWVQEFRDGEPFMVFDNKLVNKFLIIKLITLIGMCILGILFSIVMIPVIIISFIANIMDFYDYLRDRYSKDLPIDRAIKAYERSLLKQKTYRLLAYYHNDSQSLSTFIERFIKTYRNSYITVKYDTEEYVCDRYRRRSLGDIFLICRTYYPKCRLAEVLKILIQLMLRDEIAGSYCSQINKFVFHTDSTTRAWNHKTEYKDDRSITMGILANHYKL